MIEEFTREEFESVLSKLPVSFQSLGLVQGEYCYLFKVTNNAGILVRSSIDRTGVSRDIAKDSLRVYPTEIKKIKGKLGYDLFYPPDFRWITRQEGWKSRLLYRITWIARSIKAIGSCSVCNRPLRLWKSKKDNENKGKWFANCKDWSHKQFVWLDEAMEE